MAKGIFLNRYSLIVKKLRRHPADLKSIMEYLQKEAELQDVDLVISNRTFGRCLNEIRSTTGIDIQYDFSRKVYYIDDAGQPEISEHILEAFDVFNALNLSDGLSRYIHFEKRTRGTENLYGLLQAIKSRHITKFKYLKFWGDSITERTVAPYALKEFNNRWYLMAKDGKDEAVKSFALDRISELVNTTKKFKYPEDYDIENTYRYCFGIITSNGKAPEDIILSFDAFQGKYIKTLPLHTTQEILIDNKDELRIKLKLHITEDFIMELLSYGNYLKVLTPVSLAGTIKTEHENAFKQYLASPKAK